MGREFEDNVRRFKNMLEKEFGENPVSNPSGDPAVDFIRVILSEDPEKLFKRIEEVIKGRKLEDDDSLPAVLADLIEEPIVVELQPLLDREAGARIVAEAEVAKLTERLNDHIRVSIELDKAYREDLAELEAEYEDRNDERYREWDKERQQLNDRARCYRGGIVRMDSFLEDLIAVHSSSEESIPKAQLLEILESLRDQADDAERQANGDSISPSRYEVRMALKQRDEAAAAARAEMESETSSRKSSKSSKSKTSQKGKKKSPGKSTTTKKAVKPAKSKKTRK